MKPTKYAKFLLIALILSGCATSGSKNTTNARQIKAPRKPMITKVFNLEASHCPIVLHGGTVNGNNHHHHHHHHQPEMTK